MLILHGLVLLQLLVLVLRASDLIGHHHRDLLRLCSLGILLLVLHLLLFGLQLGVHHLALV